MRASRPEKAVFHASAQQAEKVRFARYGVPITLAQLSVATFYILAMVWLFLVRARTRSSGTAPPRPNPARLSLLRR